MSSHDLFSVSGTSPTQKKRTAIPKANFRLENHGSVCLIVPLCASARDWLDEHLGKGNGYQPYWPTAIRAHALRQQPVRKGERPGVARIFQPPQRPDERVAARIFMNSLA
jgi:hypothetical protein